MTNQARQPAGVPTGGQFAGTHHGEATDTLDPYPTYTLASTNGVCSGCGQAVRVDHVGVAHHTDDTYEDIDDEADEEHAPVLDESANRVNYWQRPGVEGLSVTLPNEDLGYYHGSEFDGPMPDCGGAARIADIVDTLQADGGVQWEDHTYEVIPNEAEPEGTTTSYRSRPFYMDGGAHILTVDVTYQPVRTTPPGAADPRYHIEVEEHYQVCDADGAPTMFNIDGAETYTKPFGNYPDDMTAETAVGAGYTCAIDTDPSDLFHGDRR